MKYMITLLLLITFNAGAEQTKITLGELEWPLDTPEAGFNFDGVTAPALDIHATITDLDMLCTSTGNWRGLLVDSINSLYLPDNSDVQSIMCTTSPPGAVTQIKESDFSYGNIHFKQRPIVAIGPKKLMNALCNQGLTNCDHQPFLKDFGSVLVVPFGNTTVKNIWDLANPDVCYSTSGEFTEAGSYGRYKRTLYAIAEAERGPAAAQALVDAVYAKDQGGRIMHRDVITALSRDKECAALLFYHIYKQADAEFPGLYTAFPLGGATDFLQPASGNIRGTQYRVMVNQDWPQSDDFFESLKNYMRLHEIEENGEHFIEMLDSDEFTDMMPEYWVERP